MSTGGDVGDIRTGGDVGDMYKAGGILGQVGVIA